MWRSSNLLSLLIVRSHRHGNGPIHSQGFELSDAGGQTLIKSVCLWAACVQFALASSQSAAQLARRRHDAILEFFTYLVLALVKLFEFYFRLCPRD